MDFVKFPQIAKVACRRRNAVMFPGYVHFNLVIRALIRPSSNFGKNSIEMDKWGRPISEYRGEFTWNFKEGFRREGRRLNPDERLSSDVRQLRLLKRKEQAEEELKRAREMAKQVSADQPPVIVDKYGEEYEVCETAKEAVERLIKSDPRLASKYQNYIKKIDLKLKPYGTSYDNSFMKSANIFPTVRAYEMAAEEFEKNQDVFEFPERNRQLELKSAPIKNDWTSKLTQYGRSPGAEDLKACHCRDGTAITSRPDDSEHADDRTDSLKTMTSTDETESLRQRWVDRAHEELARKFSADPKATEEQRKRGSCEVPLWFRRGLERRGMVKVCTESNEK